MDFFDDMDGDGIVNGYDPDMDGDGTMNELDYDMENDGVYEGNLSNILFKENRRNYIALVPCSFLCIVTRRPPSK